MTPNSRRSSCSARPFSLTAAPHTPFTRAGAIAIAQIKRQAEHLRNSGVDGVFIAGSTGEGSSLTDDERRLLTEHWGAAKGDLRLFVHVGHNCVKAANDLARHAVAAGADCVAAAPTTWFPTPTAERLTETCAAILEGVDAPFYYYHIPVLSNVRLPMASWLEHARSRLPTLEGVKFTDFDAIDFQLCGRDHGDSIELLWGVDELLLSGLALGARGAVGSTYNFAAHHALAILRAVENGDLSTARAEQVAITSMVRVLDRFGYPAAAKTVMRWIGVDCGSVRPPLAPLAPDREAELRAELAAIGFEVKP